MKDEQREELISNLKSVKKLGIDYIPLQACLGMIADALIFLLNDKAESEEA